LSARLASRSGDSAQDVLLTRAGHLAALDCAYDDFLVAIEADLAERGDEHDAGIQLVRLGSDVLGISPENNPPPVVSWLKNDQSNRFLLDLHEGSICFNGHFPSRPILPGIVQLHWSVVLARLCYGFSGLPTKILRLKFHKPAIPPRALELRLELTDRATVTIKSNSHQCVHASGTLIFDPTS